MPFSFRPCLPVVLALFCCACSTPEERADAAFAELTAKVQELQAELAGIGREASAEHALPQLEEQAEDLRGILKRIDELAIDPDMTPEARRRVGDAHHASLLAATEAAVEEAVRLGRREFCHSEGLRRLARHEYAHYSAKGVHPWARAVLKGREFKPRGGKQRK